MDLNIQHFGLEELFKECQFRLQQDKDADKLFTNTRVFSEIWTAFTSWSKSQLDMERTVSLSTFGTIIYKKMDDDKEKSMLLILNENFIYANRFKYRVTEQIQQEMLVLGEVDNSSYPPIKVNYSALKKSIPSLDVNAVKLVLTTLFETVQEVMVKNNSIEIDLGILGKINSFEKTVSFEPYNLHKKKELKQRSTVRELLDQRKGLSRSFAVFPKNTFQNVLQGQDGQNQTQTLSGRIHKGSHQELPEIESIENNTQNRFGSVGNLVSSQIHQEGNMNPQDDYNMTGGSRINNNSSTLLGNKKHIRVNVHASGLQKFNSTIKLESSPTRRFKQQNIKINDELLAAGTDPLAKEQEFSKLAYEASKLIYSTFQRPPNAQIRFPPILDKFSRTLAAPLAAQKFNLSISARIGSNYTPSAKRLYFDQQTKGIRILYLKDSSVNFTANQELLEQVASLEEELAYVVEGSRSEYLERKMHAKRICYQRYGEYIQEHIPQEFVANINNYWLKDILNLIPASLNYVELEKVNYMKNEMLKEIVIYYFESVKKSILDYVLKDEDEQTRVGIMQVFDPVVEYGDNIYHGLEPDDEWRATKQHSTDFIRQNLVINSKATLKLMELWKKYEKMHFFVLPSKKDQTMSIQNFLQIQTKHITDVKNHLVSEWHKDVIDIYQEELTQMNRDKRQAQLFFDSTATLMSNQIRQLVTDSLILYKEFFGRFDKSRLLSPTEIIDREKDCRQPIEDVFLHVKLVDEDGHVVFSDELFEIIKKDLTRIIDDIVKTTQGFPRPENTIARNENMTLNDIPFTDETYMKTKEYINKVLDMNLNNVRTVLDVYEHYAYLLDEKAKVEKFVGSSVARTREDINNNITKYKNVMQDIIKLVPSYVRMNMILVDACEIKKQFLAVCEDILVVLSNYLYNYIMGRSTEIAKEIQGMQDYIKVKADTTEKLVDLEKMIENIKKTDSKRVQHEFIDLRKWLQLLINNTQYRLNNDDLKNITSSAHYVHSFMEVVNAEEERLFKEREEIEGKIRKRRNELETDTTNLCQGIDSLANAYTVDIQTEDALKAVENYSTNLSNLLEEMADINTKEELLGYSQTEFPELIQAKNNLAPFQDLWYLIRDKASKLKNWIQGQSCFTLDPELIEKEMKAMTMTSQKLRVQFKVKKLDKPKKLADDQFDGLQDFMHHMTLVRVFSSKGLKERHWRDISEIVRFNINPEKSETLNRIIKMELTKEDYDKLEEISDKAAKEYGIEKILQKMKDDWSEVNAELKPWKETGTFVVSGGCVDEIQQILDDQIVKTLTMKGSPYAKEFEEQIMEWEDWLNYTQTLFEYWVKVQSVWLYLEPIFTSPDISKSLPQDAVQFQKVDSDWKNSIMGKVSRNLKVIEFTKDRRMLDIMKESHLRLEQVQKGLNEYLDQKRQSFPRFYFLSNDELLEILSETKDPSRVQPHLRKCFEGIQKLKLDATNKIYGMYSSEGEFVEFVSVIDTEVANGNVDQWLVWVEEQMILSVQKVISDSFDEYQKQERQQWVLARCGMAVLCVNMTYWTYFTEKALQEEGLAGAQKYGEICNNQLGEIVELVRSNINKLDRCTIEALIVLDVHNRDSVAKLVEKGISSVNDFEWQSQLRYYWVNSNTTVKIINAVCEFNYEYLGNSTRLVITPLTDRCYRTLCGAIHLNYGGAPEGPAGTGKTETVKDLAKALARQCVVFNCSDGLDYKAMEKFFKGLASSGAWSCFDEFNRIDLEVLSVVAQQILSIQIARTEGKKEFEFYGSVIPLKPTCNCFITMNPGYAGRSELPDNLKALFRSVAMMVPDYAMIAEICLYSFGFSDARNLARKIVTTYKLCSEQLSSQDHYDYGMRAVKSVLTAAGNLKRKFIKENESVLMLRAIKDVNVAKFLKYDLVLFDGITEDLFPGVNLPEIDYKNMFDCIDIALKNRKLQKVDYFIEKIIQLYEMILVRHGLMVVGLPFSGKTSAINVLADSLGLLNERGQMEENKVQIITLNPKSITMNQLYGFSDEVSHEWADGVLAVKFRFFAKQDNPDRKWLIFDGPVDAVWIENMNTVLDDNKKLCLNSGEIIAMSNSMNMIFEPMDLAAASPATVSRCGMIYMEPQYMGWEPLYQSWLPTLPKTLTPDDIEEINMLFMWIINPALKFLRKKCGEISPTQDQNLVVSLMRIFSGLMKDFEDAEFYNSIEFKNRIFVFHCRFIFSLYWSIGGSLEGNDRKQFNTFIARLLNKEIQDPDIPANLETKKIPLPDNGMIFDYNLRFKENKADGIEWVKWIDLIENIEIPAKTKPQTIIVPTQDTVRYSFLLEHNIKNSFPTLLCGPTGTGKSVYIKNLLQHRLDQKKYMTIEIGFSAQTSANQTMDIIDMKLDRRRKGVYGPKLAEKAIIFVDDLNMPTKEKYGAQPPVEILRQMLDSGGWYDMKDDKPFKNLVDIIFISAMGPPGGGRTYVTPRLLRHVNLISVAEFDETSLKKIFQTILVWFFSTNGFNEDVKKLENRLVQATQDTYKVAIEFMRPTPTKSHYLFNLRDISKVIMGICLADKELTQKQENIVRLWVHETLRVFSDRLVDEPDRQLMLDKIREIVRKVFNMNFDQIFEHLDTNGDKKVDTLDEIRGLIFTNVMAPLGAMKKPYEEIMELPKLTDACEESLQQYNMVSDKPMDLVLFQFAVEHLLIIQRIIMQPGGNSLLVGVGGSGRQSLTRLASHLNDFNTIQIEISKVYGKTEWHEDLKKLLKTAGGKGQQTVFLFTDSQIKQEGFVEDINNLLNTCEVPNLFPAEDKAEIMEMVRADARTEGKAVDGTPDQLYAYFVERCKNNLHIVLCFSPIGDAFRTRVRMFPSLVNCCTIDWFFEWPQDALVSVAKRFMKKIEMDDATRDKCTEMVQYYHQSTALYAHKFFLNLRRKYYVTPTSYLEMIITFQSLLDEKRKQVQANIHKYKNGYNQIISTEQAVGQMQLQLKDMVPQLKKAAEDTKLKMEVVAKEKAIADKLAEGIKMEEATVQLAVDKANVIKFDCEKDLNEALPTLQAAEEALNVITKPQIDNLKTMKAPAEPIKATMKAICLVMYPNPAEKKKEGLKTVVDWWAASIKLLGNPRLLQEMQSYDKDNMSEKIVQSLGAYFNDPEVKPFLEKNVVEKAYDACASMLSWVHAMHDFYYVNKKVKPKKIELAKAETEVAGLESQLRVKQAELKSAVDKVDGLNKDLMITKKNKEKLEKEYEECSTQLERAKILINNLGGEKDRWGTLADELKLSYEHLTGDVLVSSGIIAYLGAFTPTYRKEISQDWIAKCKEKEILGSEKFQLHKVLGDPVKIRQWNIEGLPNDSFSIENAILIFRSRRWPLCIDPQNQANKWIKKMEEARKLQVIKLTDNDYLRTLENAIQFGRPVLLENVPEDLDPSLTPILLKQTYVKGNTTYIKLGETVIEYSADFRFYITTKLRNPHYLPELSTKVTILNFMITYEGLNDQLLGILVKKERPDLEKEKERLIIESANNKKQLAEIEDKILQVLQGNKNILTDETAINILTASKNTSNEIKEKQEISEVTEKEIDNARETYQEVSQQASSLFFCISDLGNIDPMYQYSLAYYIDLFTQGISFADPSEVFKQRLENLKTYFLYSLYSNICRSLFEKDKLVFSMLLASRLMEFRHELDNEHWRFFLTGGISLDEHLPNLPPDSPWISQKSWSEIYRLSSQHKFEDFYKNFYDLPKLQHFKKMFDNNSPQEMPLPGELDAQFDDFDKLMILRTIRPDKIIPGVQNFVSSKLGQKFIEPPPFDLGLIYKDSSSITPLIFVLSPGSDPFASLNAFAQKKNKEINSISLGQGQGPAAQKMILEGTITGNWIVLQNCHLAVTWMTTLEKVCEGFSNNPELNPDFRLWLTSYPSPNFPTSVLQAGIKMTNEPPKGLRSNMLGSFLIDPIIKQEFFEGCANPKSFKKLLYGLCFFHAVIQERRKYGALGWNISYEFNESDLRICVRQLKMFLDESSSSIPFDAINYLAAECNYGGRVTDDKDRKLIKTLLLDYYNQETVDNPEYRFAPAGSEYTVPSCSTHEEFLQHIKTQLPLVAPPEVFGFHFNADITKDMNETNLLNDSLLICSSQASGGGGESLEDTLKQVCSNILADFPKPFNIPEVQKIFPVIKNESMNTVLTQELTRFNKLIKVVISSLSDIQKALKGELLMSTQLESASKSLFDGKVPDLWMSSSYPSLKTLGGYVQDLKARLAFFQNWIDSQTSPTEFWLSGFYFTQSFLTGVLQNYARKSIIPIDIIEFDFEFINKPVTGKPEDGAYVHGLFIEGSKWNYKTMQLDESDPKVLFVKLPTILLKPKKQADLLSYQNYLCPVYKTSARRGILSTTGHSTNFVMFIRLPTNKQESHWIKRGVALLTQLDD